MSFDHISQEKDHHWGINFIRCTPSPPRRRLHAKCCPKIKWGHYRYDEQQLWYHNETGKVQIETGWIIISALYLQFWILFVQDVAVLVKCLPVPTWVAVGEKSFNWFSAKIGINWIKQTYVSVCSKYHCYIHTYLDITCKRKIRLWTSLGKIKDLPVQERNSRSCLEWKFR